MHQENVGDYFPNEYSLLSNEDSDKEEDSETSKLFEEDAMPYSRYFIHQHVKFLWSKKYQVGLISDNYNTLVRYYLILLISDFD